MHKRWLGAAVGIVVMLALGAGLLGVLLGRFLTIQIPFLVLVVLVAFLLFALDRMLGDFRKTGL